MKKSIHGLLLFVTAFSFSTPLLAQTNEELGYPDPGTPEWRELFAMDPVDERLKVVPIPQPKNALTYSVTFKGEIAGFDVGRVFLDASVSPIGYAVKYKMEQEGIARWFSDAEATATARGTFENNKIVSHYYFNHDFESEDDQQYTEIYRPKGARRLHLYAAPEYNFYEPISEEIALGALDPMAALITMGFSAVPEGKSPCERIVPVIDGRKRFDLVMTDDGTDFIRKGGKGRFEGMSYKCKLVQIKVKGYREKDKGDIDGDLWIYLADVPEKFRSQNFSYIPVMVRAKQGLLTARLEGKYPMIITPDGKKHKLWPGK